MRIVGIPTIDSCHCKSEMCFQPYRRAGIDILLFEIHLRCSIPSISDKPFPPSQSAFKLVYGSRFWILRYPCKHQAERRRATKDPFAVYGFRVHLGTVSVCNKSPHQISEKLSKIRLCLPWLRVQRWSQLARVGPLFVMPGGSFTTRLLPRRKHLEV